MYSFYLFDSMSAKKTLFVPITENKVTLYACGMTVYDDCHLGHARVLVFFDAFTRILKAHGYEVTYARNVTDIDDKIIKKANDQGCSWQEIAEQFTQSMLDDEYSLGVARPSYMPKATEYVAEMIQMIQTLMDKGYAYTQEGDVYFAVQKHPHYGALSKRQLEALNAGTRIEVDARKAHEHDFVLWKAAKEGEPFWPSPWGHGRPGWHIECSAMIQACLGGGIDIHGGGVDLKFPHHENEIAQSECAHDHVLAKHWMHVGHVQINDEKMSKSLGNFITIKQMLHDFNADAIRLFLLKTHYRKPLSYTQERLNEASVMVSKWRQFAGTDYLEYHVLEDTQAFTQALLDDINTPLAIQIMQSTYKAIQSAQAVDMKQAKRLQGAFQWMLATLGLMQRLEQIDEQWVLGMIDIRNQAKAEKDYQAADAIRDELRAMGIVLEDSASGVTWRQV